MKDLSIVIGSHNNRDFTINAIESIYKFTKGVDFEIILIDDASEDDIYEYAKKTYPNIILIKNEKNLRYSKTYNKGSRLAKGKYILHMNADMFFTKDINLFEIVDFMNKNKKVGMLGNKVVDFYDGKLDPDNRHQIPTLINAVAQSLGLYKVFPKIKWLNYYMSYLSEDEMTEVGGVGGFMLFRKELLKDVGFLDEKFAIYCQDTDFCYRTIKKGWKIIYYPESMVIHVGAGAVKRYNIRNQLIFHQDLLKFYKKNLVEDYPKFVEFLIYIGLFFRFFVFLIVEIVLELKNKYLLRKSHRLLIL